MTLDEAGFRAVYEAHAGGVLAYAARRVAQPWDAHDVLAETMLVVWRRREELPPAEELRPWLFGVARRVLANQRRSSRRRAALDERLATSLTPASDDHTESDGVDVIARAMALLDTDDREVLRLVAWEGLSSAELAIALGCAPAAARKRLERARRRLRNVVETGHRSQLAQRGHVSGGRPAGWLVNEEGTDA